jgi:hypothetical protein
MECAFFGENNFNIIKMHGTTIKIMLRYLIRGPRTVLGLQGNPPVDREGISHEKPGSWQSFRNVSGCRNRAAVDTQQNAINLHVLN